MVAATIERTESAAVVVALAASPVAHHACVCPCGRHVGDTEAPASLPVGFVFTRKYCMNCRDWRVFDAATGKMRHDRDKPRRVVK